MRKIGAVILAAGESSRFGQSKQLISFRGKSLLRRIINAAREPGCSPLVVVIGSGGEKIHPELAHAHVIEVRNTNWHSGIGSSIRVGVRRLIDEDADVEAVVLLVCDQLFVDANTIRSLIILYETTKKAIIASSYADTLGVPALFDRSLFKELLSLSDEAGAKSIILQNRQAVAQFPFPEGAVDIDTWDDLEKVSGHGHPERNEGSS